MSEEKIAVESAGKRRRKRPMKCSREPVKHEKQPELPCWAAPAFCMPKTTR